MFKVQSLKLQVIKSKENRMPQLYLEILDLRNIIILCKFRIPHTSEIGRWQNIERNNRKCLLYDTNDNWR